MVEAAPQAAPQETPKAAAKARTGGVFRGLEMGLGTRGLGEGSGDGDLQVRHRTYVETRGSGIWGQEPTHLLHPPPRHGTGSIFTKGVSWRVGAFRLLSSLCKHWGESMRSFVNAMTQLSIALLRQVFQGTLGIFAKSGLEDSQLTGLHLWSTCQRATKS